MHILPGREGNMGRVNERGKMGRRRGGKDTDFYQGSEQILKIKSNVPGPQDLRHHDNG